MTSERRAARRSGFLALAGWGLALAACGDSGTTFDIGGMRYAAPPAVQFKLPKVLREISGLALDSQDRLYAVNDEHGVIYEIDFDEGRVLKRFGLAGGVQADFEGIATAGEALYLASSDGTIYETRIGEPEAMLAFTMHRDPLPCEVEGLGHQSASGALLVACKNLLDEDKTTGLRIYLWDLETRRYRDEPLTVPRDSLRAFLAANGYTDGKKVQPTAVTEAADGSIVILAGRQHLLLELTPDGALKKLARLQSDFHRQAEGVSITTDGRLLISDEGDSKGSNKSRGRLSIYEPAG